MRAVPAAYLVGLAFSAIFLTGAAWQVVPDLGLDSTDDFIKLGGLGGLAYLMFRWNKELVEKILQTTRDNTTAMQDLKNELSGLKESIQEVKTSVPNSIHSLVQEVRRLYDGPSPRNPRAPREPLPPRTSQGS